MKMFVYPIVAASLALGTMSLVGCTDPSNQPASGQSSAAGGNGSFGTDPSKPGQHSGNASDTHSNTSGTDTATH